MQKVVFFVGVLALAAWAAFWLIEEGSAPAAEAGDLQARIQRAADAAVEVYVADEEVRRNLQQRTQGFTVEHDGEALPETALRPDDRAWAPSDLERVLFDHLAWLMVERDGAPDQPAEPQWLPDPVDDNTHRVRFAGLDADWTIEFATRSADGRLTEIRILDLTAE